MYIYYIKLSTDFRYRLRSYPNSFSGRDLVDWLVRTGLAPDRIEGVAYGRRLLLARVIHHVTKKHHFNDTDYLYQFADYLPRPRLDSERSAASAPGTLTASHSGAVDTFPETVPDIEDVVTRMAQSCPATDCPCRRRLLSVEGEVSVE